MMQFLGFDLEQPEAQDAGMLRQLAVISCVEDSEVLGRLEREWRLKANVGNFAVGMAMLRTVADSIMAFATTQVCCCFSLLRVRVWRPRARLVVCWWHRIHSLALPVGMEM